MRVANILNHEENKPIISFEFSRAKDEKAAANLDKALTKLKVLNPNFVTVTFGAGGSTSEGSIQLADKLKNQFGFDVVSYIAGVGISPSKMTEVLDKFQALGVETVFVIRGDAPTWDKNYVPNLEAFTHASDMVPFIKKNYDFCLGVGAYPEGHLEAESLEKDIEYLKLKVKNGAEYIVAQYFYDNQYFFDFLKRARAAGIIVPIVPGIMPIYSEKLMNNLAKVCGITITKEIRDGLAALPPDDKSAVSEFGLQFALKQCRELLKNGVSGLHFYTMNRAKTIVSLVETLREEGLLI
ncbi:MAG: 5,10-methylenetetrahydrofolate reductase [Bacteroidetes bacterium]|jgi:methylenetetrahydrofolate reductase (NADPH)|nr:5,10-methylenetetrahydrofolate reductase [Bacteroidota bacterium]MBT6687064.1 5,10-methylenetetrahydrofolate reductase [Bacteroidota bacterium]MBT7142833.1 5,10-methylenetetrahydrofolate reductase [Bacteroidota bacterium]MBT7492637.1 5,10-methylenetetrahydrofolate reductase [Bacteroidota bacterium]